MKVAFITDGGLKMGMGHVYRCLTLAEEIKNAAEIYFLTKEGTKIVVNKISVHGYMVSKLKSDKEIIEKIRKIKPDVVVIDKPVIDINFTKVLKNNLNIERLVLFDSPSKANMYADVVVNAIIDSNFENKKYIDKITNTLYFYGPRYLTLRKMFYKYKNKKDRINDIKNILLTFGGSDPSNLTCKVLKMLINANKNDLKITIVLGPHFIYYDKLNKVLEMCRHNGLCIKIYKDIENIAELMYNSDLVITSPGLSMFESLFIGVPTIAICQNDLQKNIYKDFEFVYFIDCIDNIEKIIFKIYNSLPNIMKTIGKLEIGEGKKEIIGNILSVEGLK
ncbi:UDP-2,4-diacetamido-2,4,6-trideoxy-beta-L-altropyranose hydrolase [Methanothermococcus sp. SCGC AD-155-K20]|nr:UDP-2,4-diacetamido-2,4,6-trideoxy-beta-L-altropyranose hydrolase [Methanothermococcus sp. SCGC AD-155-K20]